MSIVSGAIIKAKADNTGTPGGLFKVFSDPNGATIGTFKPSSYVGRYVKELGNWSQIELRTAMSGKKYGWILTDKIMAWSTPYTYVIVTGRTGVNVRKGPGQTYGVIKQLNGGQIVGTSDGYQEGGFVLFALNGGGLGWVSKDYVIRQTSTPTGSPTTTPTNGTTKPPVIDTIPDEKLDLIQYAGPAVIFLSCILLLTLVRYAVKFSE